MKPYGKPVYTTIGWFWAGESFCEIQGCIDSKGLNIAVYKTVMLSPLVLLGSIRFH